MRIIGIILYMWIICSMYVKGMNDNLWQKSIEYGLSEFVKLGLDLGKDPNAIIKFTNSYQGTGLHYITRFFSDELISNNEDINICALYHLPKTVSFTRCIFELCKTHRPLKTNLNLQDRLGNTALHNLIIRKFEKPELNIGTAFTALILAGSLVDIKNNLNCLPIEIVTQKITELSQTESKADKKFDWLIRDLIKAEKLQKK